MAQFMGESPPPDPTPLPFAVLAPFGIRAPLSTAGLFNLPQLYA